MNTIKTVSEENTLKDKYAQAIYSNTLKNTKPLLSKGDREIRACMFINKVSLEASLGIFVICKGMVAEPKIVKKSALTKTGCFNFLLDSVANFSQEDITNVYQAVINLRNNDFEELPKVDNSDKERLDIVYKELCIYCAQNKKPDEIFMKDGYWNVLPNRFKQIVALIDCGYTPLAVKKAFKAFGFLRSNSGREYDYAINLNPTENKSVRFISFIVPQGVSE